jgi:hypothetical protein
MRREGGEVIFVDLLRGDDHTLSEMIEDRGGFSEVEAMAKIDRFIFEVKNAIARQGRATIEGFGTMTLDPKGVYQFQYAPKARPTAERAVQEKLFGKEPAPVAASQHSSEQQPRPEAVAAAPSSGTPARDNAATRPPAAAPQRISAQEPPRRSVAGQQPVRRPASAEAQRRQAPAGLQRRPAPRKPTRHDKRRKLSRVDIILIIAITAALIALVSMAFGLTATSEMPFQRYQ